MPTTRVRRPWPPLATLSSPFLPIPPVRRFPSEVLGVWRFNQTLQDEVAENDFVPSSGSSLYTQFDRYELLQNATVSRYGLQFEEDKSYIVSQNYYTYTDLTVAFWWYSPALLGFTRHFTTRELEPKVAPLFAIGDPVITATGTNLQNTSIVIAEVAYSKTQNAIRVYLAQNGSDVSHILTSEPYVAPALHYVLVTHLAAEGGVRIDVDGKTGILHSAIQGSIDRTGDLRVNGILPGYSAHHTTQTGGYMFDLVLTNYGSRDNEALKAMRYGYEHITDSDLFDSRFAYFPVSYPQPSTISTTKVFADGGNIFVARSNGQIVKGTRPVWDKEFKYPNPRSIALLNSSQVDGVDRIREWAPPSATSAGGLRLKGVTIRI